jgi:C-terminal peptidase prc
MFNQAMNAMFEKLDPYSSYVTPSTFRQIREELSGSYGGIGVSIIKRGDGLLVMSVRENGPALEAGILAGDLIIMADSVSLGELSGNEASNRLRGPDGSEVNATVYRSVDEDTLEVTMTRRRIPLQHVPFAGLTNDSMLYMHIVDFGAGTSDDVRAALDSLLAPSRPQPNGIILDMRGNPGGLLSEAYKTADLFLEPGKLIVGTDARSIWKTEEHFSKIENFSGDLPIAILVDNGTASAAEIVSGSLRQLGRATLIGDTTYGKGLVQGFTRFPDGSGLRLTISRYFLEGGIYLNEFDSTLHDTGHGLPPDHYFKFVNRNSFPRRLENSLLLHEFAIAHQDEIIESAGSMKLSNDWLNKFEAYCKRQGFVYRSRISQAAKLVENFARYERVRAQTMKLTQRITRDASRLDRKIFTRYADYIKMRLKQLAIERKFGTYQSYADVIIQERSDIRMAAEVIMRMNSID